MPQRFPRGAYPQMLVRADGPFVWDVDGNRYVDLICGLGALTLGAKHPAVERQVRQAFAAGGPTFSLPHTRELAAAERLVAWLGKPGYQVRFTKTGSEACAGAVRIARRATGRGRVIVCGYFGWHDWYAASRPSHDGVPSILETLVGAGSLDDLEGLGQLLNGSLPVAAVFLEPAIPRPVHAETLQEVCRLARQAGALVVYDESLTGLRVLGSTVRATPGVPEPDLLIFGKALAGGYPLAAVMGDAALMRYGDVVSGTFSGEALSLAASLGVADVYEAENVPALLHGVGLALKSAVNAVAAEHGQPEALTGHPVHPLIALEPDDLGYFVERAAVYGVLVHPAGLNVTASLEEQGIANTAEVLAEAYREAIQRQQGLPHAPAQGAALVATPYAGVGGRR